MKWIAISGSWRKTNSKVKKDVEKVVNKIIKEGNGIISGGALGVDYIATQVILDFGNPKKQLRLYLPITLKDFCDHYFRRAKEGVITKEQATLITTQLKKVKEISPKSVIDNTKYSEANIESYYARNTSIIKNCDILCAFQVNDSKGTQDAIDKAKEIGKKIVVKKYIIK